MFDYAYGMVTFNLALTPVFTSLTRFISGLPTGFIYLGHIGERWEKTGYLSTDYYIVKMGKKLIIVKIHLEIGKVLKI